MKLARRRLRPGEANVAGKMSPKACLPAEASSRPYSSQGLGPKPRRWPGSGRCILWLSEILNTTVDALTKFASFAPAAPIPPRPRFKPRFHPIRSLPHRHHTTIPELVGLEPAAVQAPRLPALRAPHTPCGPAPQ
uniref:Uncharacterized protein n=1 Tax=Mycena chlorophos TaxID=658473 RepID=A0ABQ0KUT1_MYCCL|nr:predicted protein [Mycena chlorophos]